MSIKQSLPTGDRIAGKRLYLSQLVFELNVRLALIETDVRYDAEAAVVDFSVVVVFEVSATGPETWSLFRRELPDKLRAVEATIICVSQNTADR